MSGWAYLPNSNKSIPVFSILLKSNFSTITALTVSILLLTILPVFADKHITFQKTLDVEKTNLQETLLDVKNFKKVFPDYVRSVEILEKTDDKILTEFSLGVGIIPLTVMVEHNTVNENTHELNVISGVLKGTEVTTKLTKTWGYDGLPEKGTIVQMDMSLKVSGFLALLGTLDENLIHYALDSSLLKFQDFSNDKFSQDFAENSSVKKKRR